MHEPEVDATPIEIDPDDLNLDPCTEREPHAGALAAQLLTCLVESEIVASEFSDVHQTLDIHGIERDEQTESRHRADRAAEFLAQELAHVLALEPRLDITACLVGAAFIGTAMQARSLPGLHFGRFLARLDAGSLDTCCCGLFEPAGEFFLCFARSGQRGKLIALVAQDGLDDTVHQQIGVTSNRAGEVGVGIVGQPEVPTVDGGVDRLLHAPQQHGVNLLGVGTILRRLGDGRELMGFWFIAHAHGHAHGAQVVAQHLDFFGGGPLVHTVQTGALAASDEIGCTDVGRQHGLFDELVGLVAHPGDDLLDATVLVADDLGFDRVEIDGSAGLACVQQRLVCAVQVEQVVDALGEPTRLDAAGVGENGRHLRVGETGMAVHDGRIELVGVQFALGGDQHVTDHAQAIHLGVQGTQAVGELLGQHGNDAAREINAGGTFIGIDVDGIAGVHVMAHVGNGHQQAPALAGRLAAPAQCGGLTVDGIVKIAGVLAVDGDERHIGEIDAALTVAELHGGRQRLGNLQTGIGEHVGHTVLAHGDLDFHARVVHLAQHFGHPSDGLAIERRRLGEFDHHHLPGTGRADGVTGDEHILAIALVLGGDEPDSVFLEQATDEWLGAAFENFEHLAFGAPLAVVARHARLDAILVEHSPHFIRRQIDIHAPVVRDEETMSVAMPLHHTDDFLFDFSFHVCFFHI